jgi:hypothetical protein
MFHVIRKNWAHYMGISAILSLFVFLGSIGLVKMYGTPVVLENRYLLAKGIDFSLEYIPLNQITNADKKAARMMAEREGYNVMNGSEMTVWIATFGAFLALIPLVTISDLIFCFSQPAFLHRRSRTEYRWQ